MFKLTKEDRNRFFHEPLIVKDEALFCVLAVANVLAPHYFLSHVLQFPIAVTWLQLAISSLYMFVMGEFGSEFPRFSQINPFKLNLAKLNQIFLPGLAYTAMLVSGNIMMSKITSPAYYPVAASFSVVAHHFTRFLGCGQIYRPSRWSALLIMLVGYIIFLFDSERSAFNVVGISLAYGLLSAIYRGTLMERALHEVDGNNNELQALLNLVGIATLPVAILFSHEKRVLQAIPTHSSLWTLLIYGCLSSQALLPMIKNVVSNRLIKTTGQPPWRILELVAMLIVFVLGQLTHSLLTANGIIAFVLTFAGRTINNLDALSSTNEAPQEEHKKKRKHSSDKAKKPAVEIPDPTVAEIAEV